MKTITKREYFLAALRAGVYRYKRWVLSVFTVTRPNPDEAAAPFEFALLRRENGRLYYLDADKEEVEISDQGARNEPLFAVQEELLLLPDDLPIVHKTIQSTYGQALANAYLLLYPFGRKIDYMAGQLNPDMFDRLIEKNLVDDHELDKAGPMAISVSEMKRYSEATTMLCEYTQLCVPAATKKTMTVDPKIAIRRTELLEEYKDRLHDPVVQTLISNELIKMDRAWMKGDLGEGFYFKSKSYDVVRKKQFLMQGAEQGFDVPGSVVPTSLSEGWDVQYFPDMFNASREGSYLRGAMTAQGGEAAKFNYRIFQNTRIVEDDCGSPYGLTVIITNKNKKNFITNTIFIGQGLVELSDENIEKYVGRVVRMRSPAYCRTEGANLCATCMGKNLSTSPEAISTYAAGIGSTFMGISMSAMHGKSLSVAEFVIAEHIR